MTTDICRNLRGKRAAVDVVVVTPEEVERYRDSPYLVIRPALSEGKVVYGGVNDIPQRTHGNGSTEREVILHWRKTR